MPPVDEGMRPVMVARVVQREALARRTACDDDVTGNVSLNVWSKVPVRAEIVSARAGCVIQDETQTGFQIEHPAPVVDWRVQVTVTRVARDEQVEGFPRFPSFDGDDRLL